MTAPARGASAPRTSVEVPPLVAPRPRANVTDLLLERAAATPQLALFARPDGEQWRDVSAAEFLAEVRAVAKGLIAAGVPAGGRIGMMADTGYAWSVVDFAAWFAGAVLVPIYETSSPYQIRWNLADSGAEAVVLGTALHAGRFEEVRGELPGVRSVWRIDGGGLQALAAAGSAVSDDELEARRSAASGADVATIIYTSGTTGRPKGCVLTHANFVELSRNTTAALAEVMGPGASLLLFLTMAHVFARVIAVICVHAGVKVGHQHDTTRLMPTLRSFRPTFLLAVPRVFEKVYNAAEQQAESTGRGAVFRRAAEAAVDYSRGLDRGRVPLPVRVRFALYDRLVLRRLRTALGGRVRWAVSGSAPLGERLGHFYRGLGVQVLEGYGLTETTAPASVNRPGSLKIGTVGPPLPGTAARIAPDGEIRLRGVGVFAEYWRNPEATAEAFEDGWFRTGDLGAIDADGHLSITGRSKEILVTAGGKNVAPAVLEDPIRAHPLVSQVVVVGDRRPFVAALVTLDAEMLPLWLRSHGLDEGIRREDAAVHPVVRAEVQRAIDEANTRVSRAESIRAFRILPVDLTEQDGHLTPKLSIRRHAILADFDAAVRELYDGARTPGAVAPGVQAAVRFWQRSRRSRVDL